MAADGQAGGDWGVSPIARPRSLTALITDQIRDLIITGRLALGEQLSENALAEQLGVSRTPVREAFLRLEAERLVVVQPQRGTFVFRYDATELREICELREVLETGALRVALARGRETLIAGLRQRVDAAEQAAVTDPAAYQPFDTAFHETLVEASENRELIDAYRRISGRIRAVRYRVTRTIAQVANSQIGHREIMELMASGADEAAGARLRHHVYNSYRFFIDEAAEMGVSPGRTEPDKGRPVVS